MAASTDHVLFALDERGVVSITLNRPARLNAINMEMRDLLWEYLRAARDIPEAKVIVFRGEGRAFSAGADISEFGSAPSVLDSRRARQDRDVWALLLTHRCRTIAQMHGFCFGAGLELPLCCDTRIAGADATFALPEVTLGYIPSAGGTQTLTRLVGPALAADMILTGEPIDATAALQAGLIDELADPPALGATVEAAVQRALASEGGPSERRQAMLGSSRWAAI